ncbi:hypothetical protein H9Q72_009342 [Fusarium xylarioides]|uniref:Helicase n=1 Tax=Fusarium xylarioides TaxID=221167 RepID=A0A9P7HMW1_9HYPO|nr:hypothetical protein H9Q72_009342 [Fusarium xylarioides]
MLGQRRLLPVMQTEAFERFVTLYTKNQVVIVNAETGSGKSTQLTQRIMYLELEKRLQVVCTQPRRIAARELGKRVSAELDVAYGEQVGVHHRHFNKTSKETRLKFATEGILLRQCQSDPLLSEYSCVIIDECHERTTDVDILLSLLKRALRFRSGLKVVIMSATMNSDQFMKYFNLSEMVNIQGRTFPVEIQYLEKATPNYCEMALYTVKHICDNKPVGDILVFLASTHQIERAVSKLRKALKNIDIWPLYSKLSQSDQAKALQPRQRQRCIVATNIAETSLTIDGISYVVDGGVEIQSVYNPRVGMHTMQPAPISKASAAQRAGRAGRTRPGVCYRLYTMEIHDEVMIGMTPPGILKDCFTTSILALKSAGINSVGTFDFLDAPHGEVYLRGLEDLRAMKLIDDDGTITQAGKVAATLPIDPIWYNSLQEAVKLGCLSEIIDIASLASVQSPIFLAPYTERYAAQDLQEQFKVLVSDHITELNTLYTYLHRKRHMSANELAIWCFETFVNARSLEEALQTRDDLMQWCKSKLGVTTISALSPDVTGYLVKIRKAIAKGFYHHAAIRDIPQQPDQYRTLENYPVGIHPNSALVEMDWEWVVYHKIEFSQFQYMDRCTVVELDWLLETDHFYPTNLPRDYNGHVRLKPLRAIFDEIGRPNQP